MKQAKIGTNADTCYQPTQRLVKILQERLQIEQRKDKLTLAGEELSPEEKQHLRYLQKETVRILNEIVFPSMANILYFTEMIAANKELQEIFDDDLKDLLGIRFEQKYRHKSFSPVIRRFLDALLTWNKKVDYGNFRYQIFEIIQYSMLQKIMSLSMDEFGMNIANNIVQNDFGRTWMWGELLAKRVEEDMENPHRPILFQSPDEVKSAG